MVNQLSEDEIKKIRKVTHLTDKQIDDLLGVALFAPDLVEIAQDKRAFTRVAGKIKAWLAVISAIIAGLILGMDNLKIFLKGMIE